MEIFLYIVGIYLSCGTSVFIVSYIMGYWGVGRIEESFTELVRTFVVLCLVWPYPIYVVISRRFNKPPVIS